MKKATRPKNCNEHPEKVWRSQGPRDQVSKGSREQGTKEPRNQGTKESRTRGTKTQRPRDQETEGPSFRERFASKAIELWIMLIIWLVWRLFNQSGPTLALRKLNWVEPSKFNHNLSWECFWVCCELNLLRFVPCNPKTCDDARDWQEMNDTYDSRR